MMQELLIKGKLSVERCRKRNFYGNTKVHGRKRGKRRPTSSVGRAKKSPFSAKCIAKKEGRSHNLEKKSKQRADLRQKESGATTGIKMMPRTKEKRAEYLSNRHEANLRNM